MKNIFLLALTFTSISSVSHAANLFLDLRADHSSKSYLHSNQDGESRFTFKTARLDLQGSMTETLKYRFRAGYNANPTPLASDNLQAPVNLAYVEHKMAEGLYLQAGKVNTEIGGYESATASPEFYLRSQSNTMSGPNGRFDTSLKSTNELLYLTGAKLTYKYDNQSLTYLIANNHTDKKDRNTHGLIWKGLWMDEALEFNASTHFVEGPNSHDSQHYYALGTLYKIDNMILSIDYMYTTLIQDSTDNKDSIHNLFNKLTYVVNDKFRARVELDYSKTGFKVNNGVKTNEAEYLGYSGAVEYYPEPDQKFRYHAAYAETRTLDTDVGDKGVEREFMVGMRLLVDLLK